MALDTKKLALSFGGAAVVLWILCSALVALLPSLMMSMTGHMLHADMRQLNWTLTWPGFFLGLISWTLWSLLTGWLIGWLYNRL